MNVATTGAQSAPTETPKSERQIGPETRAVRIFREVFSKSAHAFKHLKPDLDIFLKAVLNDKDAKRSDKTYARKIYADLLRLHTGESEALPDWAKKPEEPSLSDQDIQEILSAAEQCVPPPEPPPPAASQPSMTTDSDDMLDDLLVPDEPPPDPVKLICEKFLDEFKTNEYPYIRVFNHNGCRFIALGTIMGTVTNGKHVGTTMNIHCTVAGFKRLRDAEKEHAYYVDGRPLLVAKDEPNGLRKHIFCLKHTAGMKLRYWFRVNNEDRTNRATYVQFTGDANTSWKRISREQF